MLYEVLELAKGLEDVRGIDMPLIFERMRALLKQADEEAANKLKHDKTLLMSWKLFYKNVRSYMIEMYPQRAVRGRDELVRRLTFLIDFHEKFLEEPVYSFEGGSL